MNVERRGVKKKMEKREKVGKERRQKGIVGKRSNTVNKAPEFPPPYCNPQHFSVLIVLLSTPALYFLFNILNNIRFQNRVLGGGSGRCLFDQMLH